MLFQSKYPVQVEEIQFQDFPGDADLRSWRPFYGEPGERFQQLHRKGEIPTGWQHQSPQNKFHYVINVENLPRLAMYFK